MADRRLNSQQRAPVLVGKELLLLLLEGTELHWELQLWAGALVHE